MACSWSYEHQTLQPVSSQQARTTAVSHELPKKVQECLIEKSLCTLMSIGRQGVPKFRSALQNVLSHCTAVAPYMNPLDALAAANQAVPSPDALVNIPYPKKRVYTTLETARIAHRSRRFKKLFQTPDAVLVAAPMDDDLEKKMMDDVVAWIKSDPAGTEESLVEELIQKSEKEINVHCFVLENLVKRGIVSISGDALYLFQSVTNPGDLMNQRQPTKLIEVTTARVLQKLKEIPPARFPLTCSDFAEIVQPVCKWVITLPPARLFGMNRRRIKHREVEDKEETSGTRTVEPQTGSGPNSAVQQNKKLEFAIGVQPGENDVRQCISITPKGLVGIEAPITDRSAAAAASESDDSNSRMRALGQTKGLSERFVNRLTVAVRTQNAVLVPANDREREHIISKVTEWVTSKRKAGGASASSPNPPQQTVPSLQEELANKCVGKVRRLNPSTITDLLQNAGYIKIGHNNQVTYRLPTDHKDRTPSWQQQTVQTAIESCRFSHLMRQAYPRRQKRQKTRNPICDIPIYFSWLDLQMIQ